MFNLLLHLANEKKLEIQPLGTGDLDIIPLGEEDDILSMLTEESQERQHKNRTRTTKTKSKKQQQPNSSKSSTKTASTSVNSKTPTPPLIESNSKF